ncbi:MAG: AraC family transcriptional regulator [Pseudohongiellaceae bacterium]
MHKVEFSRIPLQSDKLLVGIAAKMSMASDATPKFWQRFMPRRKEIQKAVGEILYSVQSFSESDGFVGFTPETVFEKWAAVEVASRNSVPDEMQLFVLGGGHFAVFGHCGPPGEFPKTLNFIVSQ